MKEIISKHEFIEGKWLKDYENTKEHPVVSLLRKNRNKSYTVKAICKMTKRTPSTVHTILRGLIKKNLVLHKKPYFIWKK